MISVLISLLSGVDLILRPHQREQIQTFLEDLTVRSDDLKPSDLVPRVQEQGVQAVLVMLTYFELALVAVLATIFQASVWMFGAPHFDSSGAQVRTFDLLSLLLTLATLSSPAKKTIAPDCITTAPDTGSECVFSKACKRYKTGSPIEGGLSVVSFRGNLIKWPLSQV